MKTRITELLNIEYPIIQGAMQYFSMGEMAAAVSNAGGLGIFPAMSFTNAEDLRKEIHKVKSLTDKPFGVNISLVPDVVMPDLINDFVNVIVEEKVPVIETSGQKPTAYMGPIKEAGIKIIHKVATVRHALSVEKEGVDAISIVSFEAGGHPGMDDVAGRVLHAKAAEVLSIPVLAGGGIVDGKSMYAAMALGVDGVVVGTRFLASEEVAAPKEFGEYIVQFPENGTMLTLRSLKNAFRVGRNGLAQEVAKMEAEGAGLQELLPVISGRKSYDAVLAGDFDHSQISLGQGIGRIDSVKPAGQIVKEMVEEFEATHKRMQGLM